MLDVLLIPCDQFQPFGPLLCSTKICPTVPGHDSSTAKHQPFETVSDIGKKNTKSLRVRKVYGEQKWRLKIAPERWEEPKWVAAEVASQGVFYRAKS